MATDTTIMDQALANLATIEDIKGQLKTQIANGGEDIDASTPFSDYPSKVRNIVNKASPAENEAILTCTINPNGASGQLPSDTETLTALLNGARIVAIVEGISYPLSVSADALYDATFALSIPLTQTASAKVRLYLGDASTPYASDQVAVTLRPGSTTYTNLTTYLDTSERVEIGRFSRVGDTSGSSYLIKRVLSGGTLRTSFGGWSASGDWLDLTDLKTTVQECASEDAEVTERLINGTASGTDVTTLLKCLSDMKQVEVIYQLATPITNYFMAYDPVYCKTETTTLDIPTFAEDGSVASTTATEVVIKWMCDEAADEDYHLHPLFQRYTRNEDGTYTVTDLDKGYIARYPISTESVTYNGSSFVVAKSRPDGTSEVGFTRAGFLTRCKNINNIPVTVDGVDYAADDSRRFSMVAWAAEVSFLQWIGYILYGPNIQAAIMGVCTSASTPSTSNGDTDWLFNKGIRFGASDTTSMQAPCLVAGIEDGLHSSTGWMVGDMTWFYRRLDDDTLDRAMLIAIDRADYNEESSDYEALQTSGYTRLEGQVAGTNLLGAWDGAPYQDLMLFATGTTGANGNPYTGSCDSAWYGTAPSSGTVSNSARMVALGSIRSHGSSLGAFALSVGNGLSYSHGNGWRSRVSLNLLAS